MPETSHKTQQFSQQKLFMPEENVMTYSEYWKKRKFSTKNNLPRKAAFQKWKRDKDFSKQIQAERIHYFIRSAKGSSLSGNKGYQLTS